MIDIDGFAEPTPVTVKHTDGTNTVVTIVGAKHKDLLDPDFVIGVVTGDWDGWVLKQQGAPK